MVKALAAFQYNIGVCHERLGHLRAAAEAYRKFVAGTVDEAEAREARARIDFLSVLLRAVAEDALLTGLLAYTARVEITVKQQGNLPSDAPEIVKPQQPHLTIKYHEETPEERWKREYDQIGTALKAPGKPQESLQDERVKTFSLLPRTVPR